MISRTPISRMTPSGVELRLVELSSVPSSAPRATRDFAKQPTVAKEDTTIVKPQDTWHQLGDVIGSMLAGLAPKPHAPESIEHTSRLATATRR